MADPRSRSPLAHRMPIATEDGSYGIAERAFLGKLILRIDPAAGAVAVKAVLGVDLPGACQSAVSLDATLLWLGPDEWMITCAPDTEGAIAEKLEAALGAVPHQIVRVSDYYTTIAVSGARARDALAKLTTLDLHPRAFKPGEVRGSTFAKSVAVLNLKSDNPAPDFDLHIRASMADYLWCLLAVAGKEYGLAPQSPRGGERLVI